MVKNPRSGVKTGDLIVTSLFYVLTLLFGSIELIKLSLFL